MKKRYFILVIVFIITSIYVALNTTYGLRASFYTLQYFLPGKLSIQHVEGKLISHIKLKDVKYHNDNLDIQIGNLDFAWNSSTLFSGIIQVKHLIADDVSFTQLNVSKNDNSPFDYQTYLGYVKKVRINKIAINNIDYKGMDSNFNLTYIGLAENQPGQYSMFARGKINNDNLNVNANLDYHHAQINSAQATLGKASFHLKGGMSKKWNLSFNIDIPQLNKFTNFLQGKLKASGTLNGPPESPKLNIVAQSDISAITDPTDGTTYIKKLKSVLKGDVIISSKFSKPLYKVNLQLQDNQLEVDYTQTLISRINAHIHGEIPGTLDFTGGYYIGKGSGTFKGKTNLDNNVLSNTQIQLTGNELQVATAPDFRIDVSPKIELTYDNNLLNINGNVFVPSVKINRIKNSKVVHLTNDVVYTNKKQQSNPFQFTCDLNVKLGDKIKVNYDNIKTNIRGGVRIVQQNSGQLTAAGTLYTKDGTYNAYGKELKIRIGKIIYVGNSILDPGLDIEAIHSINRVGDSGAAFIADNKITVGVKVRGTLSQPKLTLISTPSLSQNDILSYLLFDTPASRLSLANSLSLMSLAASINNDNKPSTFSSVQKKIDKLGITVGSTEVYDPMSNTSSTASTIGISKKIGKKITISYQASPFNNFSVFGLRYQLNKYLALRTEVSELETTTDLIFEIEKD